MAMKTQRFPTWVYPTAAMLVFVMVMAVSAHLAIVLAPSANFNALHEQFQTTNTHSIYMPILMNSASPQGIITDQSAPDNSSSSQTLDEGLSPSH
jgi:hypothetical protein